MTGRFDAVREAVLAEISVAGQALGADVDALRAEYNSAIEEFRAELDAEFTAWSAGSTNSQANIEAIVGRMKARFARIALHGSDAVKSRAESAVRVALSVVFKLILI